jgi:hypothetical protein
MIAPANVVMAAEDLHEADHAVVGAALETSPRAAQRGLCG